MQGNRRMATWAGAILGAVLALVVNSVLAHAAEDEDGTITEEFHHTYPLAAGGRIELANVNGGVHITAWDENQVKVDAVKRARSEEELKEAEIRIEAGNDFISISTHYRELERNGYTDRNPASVEYTLMVPRRARLNEIKLVNGALELSGVVGEVRASSVNGRLRARELGGPAKLATVNGTLEAQFGHAESRSIELSSVNGSIDLTLPSDVKASLEANTMHGGIENDFGLRTNDHHWSHEMRGELGGGGVEIKLSNVNGGIDIHHADDGRTLSPAKDTGSPSEDKI